MKKISIWLLALTFSICIARAQDAATQQQIDKLTGEIQDLQDSMAKQGQKIDDLAKQISDLSDKVNTPAVNNSASADDLKALAAQVQEIDKKRQDDRDLILKQIEALGKLSGSSSGHKSSPKIDTGSDNTIDPTATPAPNVPTTGHNYQVKDGDTLGAIIKAYRAAGVKVTLSQLKAANPKMNPNVLIPGETIFIPDANAK